MKTCPDCGESKELYDFGSYRKSQDGRYYICKSYRFVVADLMPERILYCCAQIIMLFQIGYLTRSVLNVSCTRGYQIISVLIGNIPDQRLEMD